MQSPIIMWFRQDLRLADNLALQRAIESGQPVIPLFILDRNQDAGYCNGGASLWWLHHSLHSLSERLRERGSRLILRAGSSFDILRQLLVELDAAGVYFSRGYSPDAIACEGQLASWCQRRGISCKRFTSSLLLEPEQVATAGGSPYKVFTPFWRACQQQLRERHVLPQPDRIPAPTAWPDTAELDDWQLLPTKPDWSLGLSQSWQPGEPAALRRLDDFIRDGIAAYSQQRDYPAIAGTSRLSAALHFGELSPQQLWQQVRQHTLSGGHTGAAETFLAELGWREFSYHQLFHWPDNITQPFQPRFTAYPWRYQREYLLAWQRGETGYPLVDAAMKQLWHCGWMHNRLRMVVASFLTKHLLLHWRQGADWFRDTLVDADLANNTAGWQWVAGCGADAAPFFRIFNPQRQSERFDGGGEFIRAWLPVLQGLPDKYIHAPWQASEAQLAAAGVELGCNYPNPIVVHEAARERALAAYKGLA